MEKQPSIISGPFWMVLTFSNIACKTKTSFSILYISGFSLKNISEANGNYIWKHSIPKLVHYFLVLDAICEGDGFGWLQK